MLACSSAGTEQLSASESSSGDNVDSSGDPTNNPSQVGTSSDEPTTNEPTTGTDPTGFTTGPASESTGTPGTDTATTEISGSDTSSTSQETGTGTDTVADTSTGTTTADSSSSSSTGEPPESCDDGVQNGDETDLDCGGSCQGCELGQTCAADGDCASGSCEADACVEATCDDAKKDGQETDVDCGGPDCDACIEGDSCAADSDCDTGVCEGQICQGPACDDGLLNGEETDVDCGGPTCDGCADGQICSIDDDCLSTICDNDECAAASCEDGLANGTEAGVDCGGSACEPCELVINEVDYDNVDADNAEFIEIFNKEAGPVKLTGIQVVLVNGSDKKTYKVVDLGAAGTLAAGQYLLLAPPNFVVPAGVLKVALGAVDQIQNGAADGIALIDLPNKKLIDALSYEGPVTMADVTGLGVVSLVEGTALKVATADANVGATTGLARLPNGADTNNADTDWAITKNITPGAANVP